jgi:hypothetical protein
MTVVFAFAHFNLQSFSLFLPFYSSFPFSQSGIYNTTAVKSMSTCDFLGFTTLDCPTIPERKDPYLHTPWAQAIGNKALRGVNTGGIFVLEYVTACSFSVHYFEF